MIGCRKWIGAVVLAGFMGWGSAEACWYCRWCPPGCVVVPAVPMGYGCGWGMPGAPLMVPEKIWVVPVWGGGDRLPRVEVIAPSGGRTPHRSDDKAESKREESGGAVSPGGSGRMGGVEPAKGQEALPPLTLPMQAGSGSKGERIPPAGVAVPPRADSELSGEAGKGSRSEGLPPLTLPPEIPPVAGGGGSSTARYRPEVGGVEGTGRRAGQPRLSFRVWSGPVSREGYRLLRFVNYRDEELTVEVEGQRVRVPGRSQLPVWVGPVVRWRVAGSEERQWVFTGEVGGVDVIVLRGGGSGDGGR